MALKPIAAINKPLAECYPEVADDENEQLLADVRRHWLGRFFIIFSGILMSLLVIILITILPSLADGLDFTVSGSMKAILAAIAFVVVGLIAVGTFISLWVYNHSRLLITDQNVIELRQLSLFSHKIAHLNMINVEDVSVSKHGILQTLFDYGTMTIETAGEQNKRTE
jgi:uncharacterized membrane protein YdbT with pleckstrin-like domain